MCHAMLVKKGQRKKDMNSKSIVMSLGTDIECGGAQIHHNNMNLSVAVETDIIISTVESGTSLGGAVAIILL